MESVDFLPPRQPSPRPSNPPTVPGWLPPRENTATLEILEMSKNLEMWKGQHRQVFETHLWLHLLLLETPLIALTNSALLAPCVCCKFQFGTFRVIPSSLGFWQAALCDFLDAYCHLAHEIFRRSPLLQCKPSGFLVEPGAPSKAWEMIAFLFL